MTFKPKKVILVLVLTFVIVFSVICTAASAASVLRGDVNGDKAVTISDVTEIQWMLAELPVSRSFSESAADVDGNNAVEVNDATKIQEWLAAFESPYKIGEYYTEPAENPTQNPTENPTQRQTDPDGWGRDIIQP